MPSLAIFFSIILIWLLSLLVFAGRLQHVEPFQEPDWEEDDSDTDTASEDIANTWNHVCDCDGEYSCSVTYIPRVIHIDTLDHYRLTVWWYRLLAQVGLIVLAIHWVLYLKYLDLQDLFRIFSYRHLNL